MVEAGAIAGLETNRDGGMWGFRCEDCRSAMTTTPFKHFETVKNDVRHPYLTLIITFRCSAGSIQDDRNGEHSILTCGGAECSCLRNDYNAPDPKVCESEQMNRATYATGDQTAACVRSETQAVCHESGDRRPC